MKEQLRGQELTLEQWAGLISSIGGDLFPEWEWLIFMVDAYQSFMRDWEGCAVKARKIVRNAESGRVVEKWGLVFEFSLVDLADLQKLPAGERAEALRGIFNKGLTWYATMIAPGTMYPVYPLTYYEFLEHRVEKHEYT